MLLKATSHDLSAGLPFSQEWRWQCCYISGKRVREPSQCVRHILGLLRNLFGRLYYSSCSSRYFLWRFIALVVRVDNYMGSCIGQFELGFDLGTLASSVRRTKWIAMSQYCRFIIHCFLQKDVCMVLVPSVIFVLFILHVLGTH